MYVSCHILRWTEQQFWKSTYRKLYVLMKVYNELNTPKDSASQEALPWWEQDCVPIDKVK